MGTQRGNIAVFAVLAVVLVAAAGLFVALYVVARNAAGEAHDDLTAVERTLADTQAHAGDVRSTVDELHDKHDELQRTNDALSACAEPTREGIEAAKSGDRAALSTALDEMLAKCVR